MAPKKMTGSLNPYQNMMNECMARLANIDAGIRKAVETDLQKEARETQIKRTIRRKGYTAGSDTVGLHIQLNQSKDWMLKRIVLLSASGSAHALCVGGQDIPHLREVMIPTAQLTFPSGTVNVYSDSFDNDIFVPGGQDIYVIVPGSPTAYTMTVALEVEELRPFEYKISEDEGYAMAIAPPESSRDLATSFTFGIDPNESDRHVTPQFLEEYADTGEVDAEVEDHPPAGYAQDEVPLIPDVNKHLPPHLQSN